MSTPGARARRITRPHPANWIEETEEVYAFWRHDNVTGLLGGRVLRRSPVGDNYVVTAEYGIGRIFRPRFEVPGVAGRDLLAELRTLETEYRFEARGLAARYREAAEEWTSEYREEEG